MTRGGECERTLQNTGPLLAPGLKNAHGSSTETGLCAVNRFQERWVGRRGSPQKTQKGAKKEARSKEVFRPSQPAL